MAESSMWLTGKLVGDNLKNVEWQCSRCHARIASQDDAIRHVRTEHGEGTLFPRLSQIGTRLAQHYFFQDASERLARLLVQQMEPHFCRGMGAESTYVTSSEATARSPSLIPDNEALFRVVKGFILNIRHRVEQKGGYITLTNDQDGERVLRSEAEIQVALHGWFEPHCKYCNVDISREAATGRGIVDFRFSVGGDLKCLLEVKLMGTPQLLHGLQVQLPTYLQAENATHGLYVPIGTDMATHDSEVAKLTAIVAEMNASRALEMELIDFRAWKPESASRAKELSDSARYELG